MLERQKVRLQYRFVDSSREVCILRETFDSPRLYLCLSGFVLWHFGFMGVYTDTMSCLNCVLFLSCVFHFLHCLRILGHSLLRVIQELIGRAKWLRCDWRFELYIPACYLAFDVLEEPPSAPENRIVKFVWSSRVPPRLLIQHRILKVVRKTKSLCSSSLSVTFCVFCSPASKSTQTGRNCSLGACWQNIWWVRKALRVVKLR